MEDVEVGLRREAVRRWLAGESPEVIARGLGACGSGWASGRRAMTLTIRGGRRAGRMRRAGWPTARTPRSRRRCWRCEPRWRPTRGRRSARRGSRGGGEARRGRAAAAHDRADPGQRGRYGPAATEPPLVEGHHVPCAGGQASRRRGAGRPRRAAPPAECAFHALNQIDVASTTPASRSSADRGDERVVAGLHALSRHGVPGRVQFDNGGPFTSPTGVGEVVLFCVHQGATPVFIAPRESVAQRHDRALQRHLRKRFFCQERFTDCDQLDERAGAFEAFHNSQHRYQATNGRAPDETAPSPRRDPLGVERGSRRLVAGRPDRVHLLHPL